MYNPFRQEKQDSSLLIKKSSNDFNNFNSTITDMHNETAFEKTKVELVLTSDNVVYVLDGKLHSEVSDDDIQILVNYLRLKIDKKQKTKKEIVEEVENKDSLKGLTEEDLETLSVEEKKI